MMIFHRGDVPVGCLKEVGMIGDLGDDKGSGCAARAQKSVESRGNLTERGMQNATHKTKQPQTTPFIAPYEFAEMGKALMDVRELGYEIGMVPGAVLPEEARVEIERAFEGAAKAIAGPVCRFAGCLLGKHGSPANKGRVMQDTLIALWRGVVLRKFGWSDSEPEVVGRRLWGWLKTVVRRKAVDVYLEGKGGHVAENSPEVMNRIGVGPHFALVFEILDEVEVRLRRLPSNYARAFRDLLYGYSRKEIAGRLGVSVGTVNTIIHRVRGELSDLL